MNMAATDTQMVTRAGASVVASMAATEGPTKVRIKTQSTLAFADTGHRSATVGERVGKKLFFLSPQVVKFTGGLHATDEGWIAY